MIDRKKVLITIAVAALTATAGAVQAASYFKQVAHADAFEVMGQKQPETNDTTEIWLSGTRSASTTGSDQAMLFEAGADHLVFLDHAAETYTEVPLDMFAEGEGDSSMSDEARQAMAMAKAMMGQMEVTVTPTEETAEVGGWNARKYQVVIAMGMMKVDQEVWATDEIEIEPEMYNAVRGGMLARMPGFEKLLEAMDEIEGVAVKTVSTVHAMGQDLTTTTTLIEHAEKDAPEGIFDVPEGYKMVPLEMGMGMSPHGR
jgi:hypothetical protein